jgi:hypothetical protein
MSAERQSKRPEAAGEHPAERFAREVGAKSVVLPTMGRPYVQSWAERKWAAPNILNTLDFARTICGPEKEF